MNTSDLLHARYELNGRGPAAYDCYGLFLEANRRVGVRVEDMTSPEDYALRDGAMKSAASGGEWVKLDGPKPYCAVAFRIGKFVSHVGFVLEDAATFIHANEEVGIVIERLDSPRWQSRIAGFYEHK